MADHEVSVENYCHRDQPSDLHNCSYTVEYPAYLFMITVIPLKNVIPAHSILFLYTLTGNANMTTKMQSRLAMQSVVTIVSTSTLSFILTKSKTIRLTISSNSKQNAMNRTVGTLVGKFRLGSLESPINLMERNPGRKKVDS